MGGMTVVAPATGISLAPATGTDTHASETRHLVTCLTCKSAADVREPFCAHCGTRISLADAVGKKRPADLAATRALQFGLVVVLANVVIGGIALGVVMLSSDASRFGDIALALDVLKFVVIGSLSIIAIRYGLRGMRATRDGQLRRRGWAIGGVIIGITFATLVTLSMLATFAMTIVLPQLG